MNSFNYTNIFVTGAYSLSDIPNFVEKTDWILNCYENDNKQRLAMTVKFYDSIQYQIPMLVVKESLMSDIVEKNYLGISIDIDDTDLNWLYDQMVAFDENRYKKESYDVYKAIIEDDKVFEKKLLDFTKE